MFEVGVTVARAGLGGLSRDKLAAELGILLAQAIHVTAVVGTTRERGRMAILAHAVISPAIVVRTRGTAIRRRWPAAVARGRS